MAKEKIKSERVDMKLTPDQRRALEAFAAAKRTTLTGAFCIMLERVASRISHTQHGDAQRHHLTQNGIGRAHQDTMTNAVP